MSDRNRPYTGQMHTTYGERGKRLVEGLTMRDIADCYVMGVLLSSYPAPEYHKVEAGTWDRSDLYKIDLSKIDLGAVQQNMGCCIEKMMGIYPNVPAIDDRIAALEAENAKLKVVVEAARRFLPPDGTIQWERRETELLDALKALNWPRSPTCQHDGDRLLTLPPKCAKCGQALDAGEKP